MIATPFAPPRLPERARTIWRLALPIIGGMMSQNVLNLVDTWMVGQEGAVALAAVSTGGMVNFLAIASMMGLSAGVQALSARRHGARDFAQSAAPLNGALLLALLVGVPLTAVFIPSIPWVFAQLHPDPHVVALGVPYLTARIASLTAAGVNFGFRGYWNGTSRPRMYMSTLLVVHGTNLLFNWLLIFGNLGFPRYGAVGAGVASSIATVVGSFFYLILGFRHARENGFLQCWPSAPLLRAIWRLALPNCLQQMLFAAGFIAQFWIIGRLGTLETAAAGVLINVMLVAILPGLALGITATSLVGQALGRRAPRDAAAWGWDVVRVAFVVACCIALPMMVVPDAILSPFLEQAGAVELARAPLRIFAAAIWIDAAGTVLQQALLGAGANRAVMLVSAFSQWGVFLPAAYVLGPGLGFGLLGIWSAHAGYRILQAAIYAGLWHGGRWRNIELEAPGEGSTR